MFCTCLADLEGMSASGAREKAHLPRACNCAMFASVALVLKWSIRTRRATTGTSEVRRGLRANVGLPDRRVHVRTDLEIDPRVSATAQSPRASPRSFTS